LGHISFVFGHPQARCRGPIAGDDLGPPRSQKPARLEVFCNKLSEILDRLKHVTDLFLTCSVPLERLRFDQPGECFVKCLYRSLRETLTRELKIFETCGGMAQIQFKNISAAHTGCSTCLGLKVWAPREAGHGARHIGIDRFPITIYIWGVCISMSKVSPKTEQSSRSSMAYWLGTVLFEMPWRIM
jgi:hypothetical protein